MSVLTFESIASTLGIALPSSLQRMINDGRTTYGTSYADWQTIYRERMLNDPPAMISVFDFEWINAEQTQRNIDEWLSAKWQDGRLFLPFAESGAGDAYCLMPQPDGSLPVAMIWHDNDENKVAYASFDEFVFEKMIEALSELEASNDFSLDEMHQSLILDVRYICAYLSEPYASRLRRFLDRPIAYFDGNQGRAIKRIAGLISPEEVESELAILTQLNVPPVTVKPRWECG